MLSQTTSFLIKPPQQYNYNIDDRKRPSLDYNQIIQKKKYNLENNVIPRKSQKSPISNQINLVNLQNIIPDITASTSTFTNIDPIKNKHKQQFTQYNPPHDKLIAQQKLPTMYQQNTRKSIYVAMPTSIVSKQINPNSLPGIRMRRQKLLQQQLLIQNRLRYLSLDHQRNLKAASFLKTKYNQLSNLRQAKIQQKNILKSQRMTIDQQKQSYIKSMKNKHLQEKQMRLSRIDLWRKNHIQEVLPIKSLIKQNSRKLDQFKSQVKGKNRLKALQVRKKQQQISSKMDRIQNQKVQTAKKNHQSKLIHELSRHKQSMYKNDSLFKKLEEVEDTVTKANQKAKDQIRRFQQLLTETFFAKGSGSRYNNVLGTSRVNNSLNVSSRVRKMSDTFNFSFVNLE